MMRHNLFRLFSTVYAVLLIATSGQLPLCPAALLPMAEVQQRMPFSTAADLTGIGEAVVVLLLAHGCVIEFLFNLLL